MKLSAVVLDLDGTYLNAKKEVTPRNLAAVLECNRRGIRIIFATARPPRAVKEFLPEQLLSIGSFVYYNGAQVVCRQSQTEYYESIPSSLTAEIMAYCIGIHPDSELTMEVRDQWYSLRPLHYMDMMTTKSNPIVMTLDELQQHDATKILLTNFEHAELFIQKFGQRVNVLITDNDTVMQIMPLEASKEGAVKRLCEDFNVVADSVIVFGDDHNDIGLFKMLGYPVAMGNAINDLKELARETTASNDEDGVAIVLERLVGEASIMLE